MRKQCCTCKRSRLLKFFGKNKSQKDGLQRSCKDCCKNARKKVGTVRLNNYSKEWRKNNQEHFRKYRKEWYSKNSYKWTEYFQKRRKEDVYFRLITNLRGRIWHALKDNEKSDKSLMLISCSPVQLRRHLEYQFKEGMSWDNYGKDGWEVDHIKPCASFDLSSEEEQKKCFHYTNLQPLWKEENRLKSDK